MIKLGKVVGQAQTGLFEVDIYDEGFHKPSTDSIYAMHINPIVKFDTEPFNVIVYVINKTYYINFPIWLS